MEDHKGEINNRFWLIADSPPKRLIDVLSHPLDPKHPAVHNIWTPVLENANKILFDYGLRVNDEMLYIRNAVNDASIWDKSSQEKLKDAIEQMSNDIQEYKPLLIITFGSRAYETVCRALSKETDFSPKLKEWSAKWLGEIFLNNAKSFDANKVNVLPLLHISVSYGDFIKRQADFCDINKNEYIENAYGNYFAHAGKCIAEILKGEALRKYCKQC